MSSSTTLDTLFKNVALHILGRRPNITFKGDKLQVETVKKVIHSSRELYEVLNRPNVTMDAIQVSLRHKRTSAKEFYVLFGKEWPF